MSKHIWASVSLVFAALTAHAQSSVTLSGRIDNGIEYMSGIPNGTGSVSRFRAESGNWGGSYLSLTGAEDIGGGTKTIFHLEGALVTTTGQGVPDTPFNRWASVGLQNDKYGIFLIGRQLFIANNIVSFDPFLLGSWGSTSLTRGRSWIKASNAISYQSPRFSGVDLYGQYALSNASNWNGNGSTAQGRQTGLQITYTSAYLQTRGIYDEIRDPANGRLDNVFTYSREYFAGVNVFLGNVKVQGAFQTLHADVSENALSTVQQEWGAIQWYPIPSTKLMAAVFHVNGNGGAGNATIYTLGTAYYLSKRTMLHAQLAKVINSATGTFGLEANLPGNADNPLPGHAQTGLYAGIEQTF
jgi:predicted porin